MGRGIAKCIVYAVTICILYIVIGSMNNRNSGKKRGSQNDSQYIVRIPSALKYVYMIMFLMGIFLFFVFLLFKIKGNATVTMGHLWFSLIFAKSDERPPCQPEGIQTRRTSCPEKTGQTASHDGEETAGPDPAGVQGTVSGQGYHQYRGTVQQPSASPGLADTKRDPAVADTRKSVEKDAGDPSCIGCRGRAEPVCVPAA